MSKAYFMGIDTGTNSSKGVIMDDCGQILAVHSTQHEMTNPKPGHYEHDAEKDWWGDFCTISKALIAKTGIDPKDIRAVGASALGADCLPVDEHCNPLRKAILYGIDARATDEMAQLTELYGDEIVEKTGLQPSEVLPALTMLELRGVILRGSGKRFKLDLSGK